MVLSFSSSFSCCFEFCEKQRRSGDKADAKATILAFRIRKAREEAQKRGIKTI